MTATHTHRVFEAIQGLYPVTFDNVIRADPQGLLDIFEGAEGTRDLYFEQVIVDNSMADWLKHSKGQEGNIWASTLSGFDTAHEDECDNNSRTYRHHTDCGCKSSQWTNNQQWGTELFAAIEQRIDELND